MKICSIYIFIFILATLLNYSCFSQTKDISAKAEILIDKAEEERLKLNTEQALAYHKEAFQIFKTQNNKEKYLYAKSLILADYFQLLFQGKKRYEEKFFTVYHSLIKESVAANGKNNVFESYAYLIFANYNSQVKNNQKVGIKYVDKALEIALNKNNFPNPEKSYLEATCVSTKVLILHKRQSFIKAESFGEKALQKLEEKYGKNSQFVNLIYVNLAVVKHQLQKYDEALKFYQNYINFQKKNNNSFDETGLYENLGNLYMDLGNYNKAIELYEKALTIKKITKTTDIKLLKSYNRIGGVYQELGKYKEAIEYYKKALEGIIILRGENNRGTASFYNNIGECLHLQGKYNEALNSHKRALRIRLKTIGNKAPYTSNSYHNIGKAFLAKNQLDSAKYYLQNGLDLRTHLNATRTDMKKYLADSYNNMGLVYNKLNEYNKALEFYYTALEIYSNLYGKIHPEIAATYNLIGDIYSLQSKLDLAISNYQNAIITNTVEFNKESIEVLPQPADVIKPYIMLTSLRSKALNLERRAYNKERVNVTDLSLSYKTFEFCDEFLSLLRKNQTYQSDKLNLMRESKEIYEGGIRVCYDLYQITQTKKYLSASFYFSEKSKATLLSDKTIEENAKLFADIPDSLLNKEKDIKSGIASFEVRLQREKLHKKHNKKRIKAIKDTLFELKRNEEMLIALLEENFPKYHELKYNKPIATVNKVQNSLKANTTLLEYFIAKDALYVFIIDENNFNIKKISNISSLSRRIKILGESVKLHDFQIYTDNAFVIYSKIFEPIRNNINNKKIIIVPDGVLWYLNFDILITEESENEKYSFLPYLIKDYIISYAYTADLLYQEKNDIKKKAVNECLAFSYSTGDSLQNQTDEAISLNVLRNSSLDDLPGTRKEIADISSLMEGKYYYGYSANEKNFKAVAQDYAILHLALHGEANKNDPLQSKLYFTKNEKDSVEDDFLYAYELYNMQLNADLAVLSACNTGVGELEGGEGVMSLGRAFIYAGCKSLLMSQWEISDWSTSGIMKSFYTYLSKGMPKDEALYYAKLDYLKNSDNNTADPAYWAPLVFLGDSSPQINSKNKTIYYILGSILVVSMMFYGIKKVM